MEKYMIIPLEVLRRIRKRINYAYLLLVGISTLIIILSVIGNATDNINQIHDANSIRDSVFLSIGIFTIIITSAFIIRDGLRYIYLSYYHLEKTLLVTTQYYPEFFIISLITPIANLIYPYRFLSDLLKEYSSEVNPKRNVYLVIFVILYDILFIVNVVLGIVNIIKNINMPSINIIYYMELVTVIIFGWLSVKYINSLYNMQKVKLEKYYSIIKQEET
jgi:hypothetical protein